MTRNDRIKALYKAADQRILLLDGAMGTMIQTYNLEESDYRGTRFADWESDLKGNNDLLNITKPDVIEEIHRGFLEAGSDIIETNTFSSTSIAMADYAMEDLAYELNLEGAKLARSAADALGTDDKPRFVAGAFGPTNRTASVSPDVNDPGFRNTNFDALREAYLEQARALYEGGVDIMLVETIFDSLNAKAALYAIEELFDETGQRLPIIVSGTITDAAGRNLSGQTPEALWNSVRHVQPFAMGLNCAFGADRMRPYIADLARNADTLISAYPNAGLPNEFGEYDEPPEVTSGHLAEWAESGLLNIVGGCCGTTPDHIRAIAQAVADKPPREVAKGGTAMRLSGLEPFAIPS